MASENNSGVTSETAADALLKQALAVLSDAKDYLLVLRATTQGLPYMPKEVSVATQLALYRLVDQMAVAIADREKSLLAMLNTKALH